MLASLIIAAMIIGYLAINSAGTLGACLDTATAVKGWLTNTTNTGMPAEYNIWLQFFIHEQQLVFMFFVIIVRMVLAMLWWGVDRAFGWSDPT